MVDPTTPTAFSAAKTARLGAELLQSRAHVNHAATLVSILRDSNAEGPQREALCALQAFFWTLMKNGELPAHNSKAVASSIPQSEKDPDAIYKAWLRTVYRDYLRATLGILQSPDGSPALQRLGVDAIMESVRWEQVGRFTNDAFRDLCTSMAEAQEPPEIVLSKLEEAYFQYADVRCHLYANLQKVLEKLDTGGVLSEDGEHGASSTRAHAVCANVFLILRRLPPPDAGDESEGDKKAKRSLAEVAKEEEEELRVWSFPLPIPGDVKAIPRIGKKQKREQHPPPPLSASPFSPKKQRKALSQCWLALLRTPLPPPLYKQILPRLHSDLLPFMPSPLLLTDFFADSFAKGGPTALLSLSGLFSLVASHGLHYPLLYDRLYAQIEPALFGARARARFFELLDRALNSRALTAVQGAAFAKKLARCALRAPPAGAVAIIGLVLNLLRRHAAINELVHRGGGGGKEEAEVSVGGEEAKKGVDVFCLEEPDTARCRAMESSLWEMETLRTHYCPAVSRFVAALETDLTDVMKSAEVDIGEFSRGGYGSLIQEEVGRRLKHVPLAFYAKTPSTLFPQNGEGEDFKGWGWGGGEDAGGRLLSR